MSQQVLDKTRQPQAVQTVRDYVGGQWVASLGVETVPVTNPATEAIIAQTPLGTAEDVNRAVEAAKQAFVIWRKTPAIERVQVLFRLKTLLETHADALAELCTCENGKTLAESRGDLRRGIQMVEAACGMPALLKGETAEDIATGIDCVMFRQPMGVFAAICPFNFPAMVPMWFWPFAIAAGNTFVLKPSERVPLTQIRILELAEEAGLPAGVLNLVNGGKDVVNVLCEHPDIAGISFVGSTPVAKHVYQTATATGKRAQALGGAKNFMVVLPDAVRDNTVKTVLESCTGCAGQRCLAGSVILAVGESYDWLVDNIVTAARQMKPGDDLGPLISQAAKDRVSGLIQSASDEGAEILLDGRQAQKSPGQQSEGYFLGPTIITGVRPEMRVATEEIFGPVVCIAQVKTLDEAIAWLNTSEFANTASLFTTSGAAARQFNYQANPAMLGINIGVPAPMAFFSFGGAKASFFGDIKAHGAQSVNFYTDTKVSIQRWPSPAKSTGSIW